MLSLCIALSHSPPSLSHSCALCVCVCACALARASFLHYCLFLSWSIAIPGYFALLRALLRAVTGCRSLVRVYICHSLSLSLSSAIPVSFPLLRAVAVHLSALSFVPPPELSLFLCWFLCCSLLKYVSVGCSVMQSVAVWCSVLRCVAVCCRDRKSTR